MRYVFSLILASTGHADIEINSKNFPDEVLRSILSRYYDNNKDNILNVNEIEKIKELTLGGDYEHVYDLTGIQYLTALEKLDCSENKVLTNVDVSGCLALRELYLTNNKITNLIVKGCPSLEHLDCSNNKLTSLSIF